MRGVLISLLLCACGPAREAIVIPIALSQGQVDASRARSFQLWILSQVGRNEEPIPCEQLVARSLVPSDENIVKLHDPIDGDIPSGEIVIEDIPSGVENRIFYIDVYDAPNQLGERIGAGCKPSVSIIGGQEIAVELVVGTPPPAAVR